MKKMTDYVRPMVVVNEELAEGVYAASGDETGERTTTLSCQSTYMQGSYMKGDNKASTYKEKFGCKGCNAYTGNGCKLQSGKDNVDPDAIFMPAWEEQGHSPSEPC